MLTDVEKNREGGGLTILYPVAAWRVFVKRSGFFPCESICIACMSVNVPDRKGTEGDALSVVLGAQKRRLVMLSTDVGIRRIHAGTGIL